MTELLTDIGRKLGERWLPLIVLPGILYIAAFFMAVILGNAHPFEFSLIARKLVEWKNSGRLTSPSAALLIAVGLLASAFAGLAAKSLGEALERCWLAEHWQSWVAPARAIARRRVQTRTEHWKASRANYLQVLHKVSEEYAREYARVGQISTSNLDLAEVYFRVERVSKLEPTRPTWAGDRVSAVALTMWDRFGLDVPTIWPFLFLIIPEERRKALSSAQERYQDAIRLAAWAGLYILVAVFWWPGLIIVLAALAASLFRVRSSVEEYCVLLEAAIILHTPELVRTLGLPLPGVLDHSVGSTLTTYLTGRDVNA
jgi:hypothetical protein